MTDVVWFRRDLRLLDNTVLASSAGSVLPIFIFDSNILNMLFPDDGRPAFILHWVQQLQRELRDRGLDLQVFHGSPDRVFDWISRQYEIRRVLVTADYDRYARERDRQIGTAFPLQAVDDTYLLQPESVSTGSGKPYKVFTPFYRAALRAFIPRMTGERIIPDDLCLAGPVTSGIIDLRNGEPVEKPMTIGSLGFQELAPALQHYREQPQTLLDRFAHQLDVYDEERDFPSRACASRLGPHLRFGTVSVRQVLRWLDEQADNGRQTEPFRRQLYWREFYAQILYHFPHSETANFQPLSIPWRDERDELEQWSSGMTGVPMVDAGMRQLVGTGYMHNRCRMITASFLTKNLLHDWQAGERFFARYLMDYDAATNVGSWQWAASTGTDAQPYFRVFNPWRQGARFDPDASYIKKWIPELAEIAPRHLHDEHHMRSNPIPGYPVPIMDHRAAAARAVDVFKQSRNSGVSRS